MSGLSVFWQYVGLVSAAVSVTLLCASVLAHPIRVVAQRMHHAVTRHPLRGCWLAVLGTVFFLYGGTKPTPPKPPKPIDPPSRYSISYVGVSGARNPNVTSFTTNDLPITLSPLTRTGYVFKGWMPNAGVIPVGTTSNVTFRAAWEEIVPEPGPEPEPVPPTPTPDPEPAPVPPSPTPDPEPDPVPPIPTPDPEPEIPALYPNGADVIGNGEAAPYALAAAVYDGVVTKGDAVAGTIQVKVSKWSKGASKVTATVQLGTSKLSFKGGLADASGAVSTMSAKGRSLDVSLGVFALGGTLDGGYTVEGARNVFTSKSVSDGELARAALAAWQKTFNVLLPNGRGTLSVAIAAKGKVKVAGTVDGTKVSAASQLLVGEKYCLVPVFVTKKLSLAFNLWLDNATGACQLVGSGLDGAKIGAAGTLRAGATVMLDTAALAKAIPGLCTAYLPNGLAVSQSGAKWLVAGGAKAGKVVLDKKTGQVDESKLGANPSGLKLTYKAKDGTFKGTFKAYALEKGKIKVYTVNIEGHMVGDTAYGMATLKKPAVKCGISVKP